MGQAYSIKYHPLVVKDLAHIDTHWRREIQGAIEEKLASQPDMFGTPLRQSLRGYRKLRVGDYRIVYRIERAIVKVLGIIHRSGGYQIMQKRA